ncbi:GntR family transcriptional regulator [Petrotoga sp. 9PW.55.5.1]|uniref:GntR family transcriptional regulator n=1 Tax=Petrotoga sp. 9PW.55.5.1 TaxID=1308979 RepID=UPI000DC33F46|nr:GntR family transcriptional regulator [Petrotoga sp. 9PW.55.5.1]RAO98736.1 GntR family transcriptional regulator [Petrotoga sp. 9PW.55.5.1]
MEKIPIPLYYKLYVDLKEDLEENYKKGDKILTENEICNKYSVSRLTVRRALDELSKEGLIERKRGQGTFYLGRKQEEELSKLTGFTDEAIKQGHKTTSIVLENKLMAIPQELTEEFKMPKDGRVVLLKRVRYLDEEPYAIESSYLNPYADIRILNIIERDMSNESLYRILNDEFGIVFSHAVETLEVTTLNKEEGKFLSQKEGAIAALRTRYTYIKDEKCIEYVRSLYRGDRYKFRIVRRA